MGEVIHFKKPKAAEKARGKTLCREGFHRWVVFVITSYSIHYTKLYDIEKQAAVQRAFIVGGGEGGIVIAELLEDQGVAVKIFGSRCTVRRTSHPRHR